MSDDTTTWVFRIVVLGLFMLASLGRIESNNKLTDIKNQIELLKIEKEIGNE